PATPLPEGREAEPPPDKHEADAASRAGDAEKDFSGEDFSKASDMDAAHDDMYDNDTPPPTASQSQSSQPLTDWTTVKSGQRFEGDEDQLESTLANAGTLKDHLLDQLAIAALHPEDRMICVAMIDSIDEAGYLRADL